MNDKLLMHVFQPNSHLPDDIYGVFLGEFTLFLYLLQTAIRE